jgi:alkyldihydroxyacetonephosphate synthase
MSDHVYKHFEPKWFNSDFSDKSYRSIFKWGEKLQIKAPRESLFEMMKEQFGLTDNDFTDYKENLGLDAVELKDCPVNLTESPAKTGPLREIVGPKFVRTDDYAPTFRSHTAKTMIDIMRLAEKIQSTCRMLSFYPSSSYTD